MSDRYFRLLERHQHVDERLRDELRRPVPDDLQVQSLKKMKLTIKDRIAALIRRGMAPRGHAA